MNKLLKLTQPSYDDLATDLIDIHNNMRSGKVDDARILVECLLNDMLFDWNKHVKFPKQPSC